METLTTLAALDRKLDECRAALRQSDDAMRGLFQDFQMAFALDHPPDPLSAKYRDFQLRLYEQVARRAYSTANEATVLDVDASMARPFPYLTGSTATAGQHLGAIGFLLQSLRLPPNARILEFGPGWGNTTLALARLGHQVTAVDVEPKFCALIQRHAALLDVPITVVNDDFFYAERVTEPFDAVIFFECFHHCHDHIRLLHALQHAVVPDGTLYFGAEPILRDYPVPWGLRMDGEALWAIRQNGWLELGFRESYFREALHHTGWTATKRQSADLPWVSVWEAVRRTGRIQRFGGNDPRLGTLIGRKLDGAIVIDAAGPGFGVFGPHIPLSPGHYRSRFDLKPGFPLHGVLEMDACAGAGVNRIASRVIDTRAAPSSQALELDFALSTFEEVVEVRLFCQQGATVAIERLTITEVPG